MAGKYTGFDALKAKLADKPGVRNPGAIAAAVGRKKYGAKKFESYAAAGKSMRQAKKRPTEDSPGFNPRTQGNHRGSLNSRNASDGHGQYRPT